jgi:hypothetical protein
MDGEREGMGFITVAASEWVVLAHLFTLNATLPAGMRSRL